MVIETGSSMVFNIKILKIKINERTILNADTVLFFIIIRIITGIIDRVDCPEVPTTVFKVHI